MISIHVRTSAAAGGCPTGTSSTWNPSDIGANLTLSNGNLTCTHDAPTAAWRAVRATNSKSTGKWYYEYKQTDAAGNPPVTGVGNSSATLTNNVGSDVNGWGYYGGDLGSGFGGYKHSNSFTGTPPTYGQNDVIMVAWDADAGKLWFGKNGTWNNSGNPATGANAAVTSVTGTLYPMLSEYISTVVVANFGATSYAYTIPTGFCSWNTT